MMESFEQLIEQYEAMVWKIIHSLHIYKNVEEFYQTGLIALWEASARFDHEKGSFTSYAYTYIKGKILSEMTRTNKHENQNVYPKEEFWELIEDSKVTPSLEAELILSLCEDLTPNQKKWVLYTAIADFSLNDIAKLEKVSPSAVKAWRKGAQEKLKDLKITE
ncbi:sigma-70 family RNA polymerase sigma factor [Cytobacillus spartinae]